MADMIEPSLLITTSPRDSLSTSSPSAKKNGAREFVAGDHHLVQTHIMTLLSEDQRSKCRKSIARRIVDFDQPRSTSTLDPCLHRWTSEFFQNRCDGSNQK